MDYHSTFALYDTHLITIFLQINENVFQTFTFRLSKDLMSVQGDSSMYNSSIVLSSDLIHLSAPSYKRLYRIILTLQINRSEIIHVYVLAGGLFEALKLAESVPFQMVFNMFPAVETFVTIS